MTRLGLDCEDLMKELDLRLHEKGIEEIVNLRLATRIQKSVPALFSSYVTERASRWK